MPLDGHAFLLSQGWSGSGSGLRKDAISRPITVSQKKNLAGIGKDRDEAFPFWDHLYTVAASAIQIECFSSDDEDDPRSNENDAPSRSSTLELRHTSTGILSNRPPIVGTSASSGASTPTPDSNATPGFSSTPRLSLLALARRETARRGLYSRFFRGPILGPDDAQSEMVRTEPTPSTPQVPFHHDEPKKSGKQKRKIDVDECILKDECEKAERRREKRLRKEAERRKRQDAKNKVKDGKDVEIANSKPMDERVLPSSLDQGSSAETQCVKTEKKKRLKPTLVDDKLNRHTPISMDKRTLEGEDRSKRSRKRRRRDQGL